MHAPQTSKCYRQACTNNHDGCLHSQMQTLYCEYCAMLINKNNPEVPNLVIIPRKCWLDLLPFVAQFKDLDLIDIIQPLIDGDIETAKGYISDMWDVIAKHKVLVDYFKSHHLADKDWYPTTSV